MWSKKADAAAPAPPQITPEQVAEAQRRHEQALAAQAFWQPPVKEMRAIGVRQMRDVLAPSPPGQSRSRAVHPGVP
jgi:hypothetical protein